MARTPTSPDALRSSTALLDIDDDGKSLGGDVQGLRYGREDWVDDRCAAVRVADHWPANEQHLDPLGAGERDLGLGGDVADSPLARARVVAIGLLVVLVPLVDQ